MKTTPLTMTVAPPEMPSGKPSVPMMQWGKDHWSTFAYLECCAVDKKGAIDRDRMRCDLAVHPGLGGCASRVGASPTRTKGGDVPSHDDWSCFEDFVATGLCTWEGTGIHPRVKFTPEGQKIAARLRAHKQAGGVFHTFDASAP